MAMTAKFPKLTEREVATLAQIPSIRKKFSKALERKPKAVGISGKRGEYVHFRMEDPKKFGHLRTKKIGNRGTLMIVACPKGKLNKKTHRCNVGMKTQAILVPKSRVLSEVQRERKKMIVRKVAANPAKSNPLLMSVLNPGRKTKRNPLLMSVMNSRKGKARKKRTRAMSNPGGFKKGQKIALKTFDKWVRANMPADKVREYEKMIRGYKKFHGRLPSYITWNPINMGSKKLTDIGFAFSAGRAPTSTYIPPKGSNKGRSMYLHAWKDMPEVLIGSDGKTIIHSLKGKARVNNWMRG